MGNVILMTEDKDFVWCGGADRACKGAWTVAWSFMATVKSPFPKRRRSASADAALKDEITRVEQMPIAERMETALAMGKSLAALRGEIKQAK